LSNEAYNSASLGLDSENTLLSAGREVYLVEASLNLQSRNSSTVIFGKNKTFDLSIESIESWKIENSRELYSAVLSDVNEAISLQEGDGYELGIVDLSGPFEENEAFYVNATYTLTSNSSIDCTEPRTFTWGLGWTGGSSPNCFSDPAYFFVSQDINNRADAAILSRCPSASTYYRYGIRQALVDRYLSTNPSLLWSKTNDQFPTGRPGPYVNDGAYSYHLDPETDELCFSCEKIDFLGEEGFYHSSLLPVDADIRALTHTWLQPLSNTSDPNPDNWFRYNLFYGNFGFIGGKNRPGCN
jgi:hypothetical protein